VHRGEYAVKHLAGRLAALVQQEAVAYTGVLEVGHLSWTKSDHSTLAPEPGWVGWNPLWLAELPRSRSAAHAYRRPLLAKACTLMLACQRLSQWTVSSDLAQAENTASPDAASPAAATVYAAPYPAAKVGVAKSRSRGRVMPCCYQRLAMGGPLSGDSACAPGCQCTRLLFLDWLIRIPYTIARLTGVRCLARRLLYPQAMQVAFGRQDADSPRRERVRDRWRAYLKFVHRTDQQSSDVDITAAGSCASVHSS